MARDKLGRWRSSSRLMRLLFRSFWAVAVLMALPNVTHSQSRDTAAAKVHAPAATPACCSIVRIENKKAYVAAREISTGFTFYFSVKSKRLLGTLKIGQPVWADFAGKTVKLKASDATPCCAIVDAPQPPPALGTDSHPNAVGFRKERL